MLPLFKRKSAELAEATMNEVLPDQKSAFLPTIDSKVLPLNSGLKMPEKKYKQRQKRNKMAKQSRKVNRRK